MWVAGGTWHRGLKTGSHPAQSCSKKDTACARDSPQPQPGHPQIGSRLVVFMVISQLSHVQDAAVLGCLCQHRGRKVPVQHPASAHSQMKNEISGTGPQPGCAPAAHHSLVSPSGVSMAINQQPLLPLGVSPASWSPLSGNVRVGLRWFLSSCVPVCHRRDMGRCLQAR